MCRILGIGENIPRSNKSKGYSVVMWRNTFGVCGPRRQRGQAIPIGIAMMLFSIVLALTLFNTGQITSEKMRLTNTADAAAYSGMVWEARALNFQAYTNRAMVANQVSIAQIVSFVSWSKYLAISAQNLDYAVGWIPFIAPFTSAFVAIAETINGIVINVADVAIPIIDGLLEVLKTSQTVVHYASAATTQEIVREVVKRNDPQYELTLLGNAFLASNAVGWLNLTDSYESNWALNRQADIIMASRDKFTSNRGWTIKGPPLPAPSGLGLLNIEFVKAGEARLISQGDTSDKDNSDLEWEWKAKDTLSLHFTWKCFGRFGRIKTCRQEIPLGWGEAYASTTDNDIEQGCGSGFSFFNSGNCAWSRNRIAESFADSDPDTLDGYGGVRAYREIKDLEDKDPRLTLAVEVRKVGGNVRTSTKAGIGSPNNPAAARNGIASGVFRVNDNLAGNEISAVSKAEVFFQRPVRRVAGLFGATDNNEEYGNLYNPYWDVHLVSAKNERVAAWIRKGLVDIGGIGGSIGGTAPRN